ncbi:MAG: cyclase family protein [Chloroflexi bacterium]|nr:cyclase family protein [Chloroflexota bacterium]
MSPEASTLADGKRRASEHGRANSVSTVSALIADDSRVFDLSHPWFQGMPAAPNRVPYVFTMVLRHGDRPRDDGVSAANELVVLSGHTGTHLDALGHVSRGGLLHGGIPVSGIEAPAGGIRELGVETVPPILCRGVLLDVAATRHVDCLPPAYEVTSDDLEAAEARLDTPVRPGDGVLIRTGWGRYWPDPQEYQAGTNGWPGPGPAAAEWLIRRRIIIAGSDTPPFEVVRPDRNVRPVHGRLLVDAGIYILESLSLDQLGAADVTTAFVLVALPLKLVGATGSPVRPVAIVPGSAPPALDGPLHATTS